MKSEQFRNLFTQNKARGHKVASLTAYNYPMARLLSEVDLDFILVGDSLGMVELGYSDTVPVTMDDMLHHLKACANVSSAVPLIVDLPSGSYQDPESALQNASCLMEAGASGVKMEGGQAIQAQLEALSKADIPVLGHIGMLPQHVREEGGYKEKGKTSAEASQLLRDAHVLEEAGAFAVVLELVFPPLAQKISQSLAIPTVGIGSGPDCDGQILVTYDLIGMFPWFKPRFVQPKANVAAEIQRAVRAFVQETRT